MIENAIEESIPFKYLFTDEPRFGQFEIIGKNGKEGVFYTSQNDVFAEKFCVEYKDKIYLEYSIDVEKRNVVSIF